jgi:hypothetical protein
MPQYQERDKAFPLERFPWMPLFHSGTDAELEKYQQAVMRYERAFNDPKYRFREAEVLSPCPAPKPLARSVISSRRDSGEMTVSWIYRNDYGNVPLRDDVRFALSVKGSDGSAATYRDIAPDALGSEHWAFHHAVKSGVAYHYSLEPYRYCFDLEDTRASVATEFDGAR